MVSSYLMRLYPLELRMQRSWMFQSKMYGRLRVRSPRGRILSNNTRVMSMSRSVQGKAVQCTWHVGAKIDECSLLQIRFGTKIGSSHFNAQKVLLSIWMDRLHQSMK